MKSSNVLLILGFLNFFMMGFNIVSGVANENGWLLLVAAFSFGCGLFCMYTRSILLDVGK